MPLLVRHDKIYLYRRVNERLATTLEAGTGFTAPGCFFESLMKLTRSSALSMAESIGYVSVNGDISGERC